MLTFLMSLRLRPYLASNSSSKMRSSKVLEHSRPMLNSTGLAILPTLRDHITGDDDVWQPMPTSASFDRPRSTASSRASQLAEYVYRLPAAASTSSALVATPGFAFHVEPSPSR